MSKRGMLTSGAVIISVLAGGIVVVLDAPVWDAIVIATALVLLIGLGEIGLSGAL